MSYKTHLLVPIAIGTFFIASCADSESRNEDFALQKADSMTTNAPTTAGEFNRYSGNTFQTESLENGKPLEAEAALDSVSKVLNTTAAALNVLDSSHMFVRTADVRCRVDEVASSTYKVEDVVKGLGGYISDTKLSSNVSWQQQTPISEDSMKQVTKYNVGNTLTIRVPAKNLDSLLRALVPLVKYMDYRNVNVNDITLDQLSKQMEQNRLAKYNAMIQTKVVDQTNKPDKIMAAADAMLAKQEQSDYAYLESLRLNDRVLYATLSLQLYQPETSTTAIIFREKPIEPYDAGIGARLSQSVYAGWKGFSYLLAGIVLLWPVWLIGACAWIIVRWQMKKRAKVIQ
ncbi:MAG TPA: DUF4349 domain-containing protein [Bacteroidia bacterium]|nr:DUF4349 domain-containing protein [Bacteroidia bacterium]